MHVVEHAMEVGDLNKLPAFVRQLFLCTCGCHPQRNEKACAEELFPTCGTTLSGPDLVQILSEAQPESARPEELQDYVMVRELGKGNFARVWLVRSEADDNAYALKIQNKWSMLQERSSGTDTERRILERMCQHPFVVSLRRSFASSSSLYYVLEYCAGGDLLGRIRRLGRLPEASLIFYGAEILLVLQSLHARHVVYKGLRPENILLDGGGHIRLCDFSLAQEEVFENTPAVTSSFGRSAFSGDASSSSAAVGGLDHKALLGEYAAPELMEGYSYAKVSDWYAFGVLLYECLVGRVPRRYSFDVAPSIDPPQDAGPHTADLLRSLLQKHPYERLGAGRGAAEVRNHSFFAGVVWEDVFAKRVRPPFVPDDDVHAVAIGSRMPGDFSSDVKNGIRLSEPMAVGTGFAGGKLGPGRSADWAVQARLRPKPVNTRQGVQLKPNVDDDICGVATEPTALKPFVPTGSATGPSVILRAYSSQGNSNSCYSALAAAASMQELSKERGAGSAVELGVEALMAESASMVTV